MKDSEQSTGQMLGFLHLATLSIGAGLKVRRYFRGEKRNTAAHLIQKIEDVKPADLPIETMNEKQLIAEYNDLLRRGKIRYRKPKPTPVENKAVSVIKRIWGVLYQISLVSSVSSFFAGLFTGAAALTTGPVLPIIFGISFGVTLAVTIAKGIYDHVSRKKLTEEKRLEKKELERVRHELKLHLHIKKQHQYFKRYFDISPAPLAAIGDADCVVEKASKAHKPFVIHQLKAMDALTPTRDASELTNARKSKLARYVLGKRQYPYGAIALAMIDEIISKYTATALIVWLGSCTLMLLAPVSAVAASLAAVTGSSLVSGIAGGLIAAITGVNKILEKCKEHKAFENKAMERMLEPYLSSKADLNGKPKYVVFDVLLDRVKSKSALMKERFFKVKKQIEEKKKYGISLSNEEKLVLSHQLARPLIFNSRYTRTHEPTASTWIYVKKGFARLQMAVSAGQTWMHFSKTLFVAGALFGGLCLLFGPSAWIAGLVMIVGFVAIGAAVRLAHDRAEKKREHRNRFIEGLDTKISALRKRDKELSLLETFIESYGTGERPAPVATPAPASIPDENIKIERPRQYLKLSKAAKFALFADNRKRPADITPEPVHKIKLKCA